MNAELDAVKDALEASNLEVKHLSIARKLLLGENELASHALQRVKGDLHLLKAQISESSDLTYSLTTRIAESTDCIYLLKVQIAESSDRIDALEAQLSAVPWRVVWIWFKVRRFIPKVILIKFIQLASALREKHV